jgi:hypothetical protein
MSKIIKIIFFALIISILYILVKIMAGATPMFLEKIIVLAIPLATFMNL